MKADLTRLVGFDTSNPPGHEADAAAFLAQRLREAGFAVEIDAFKPGRTNVIARLANGEGPTFAFNTHIDVVPAGEGWTGNPFEITERDGKLYGRGSCDAKGPLVAMLEAMRMLAADRDAWRGELMGVFVSDEEVGSMGARHFAAAKPKIDYAVIGEPTSNSIVIAHKGSMRPIVRVHGVSAHSSTPDLGENAIYNAARFLGLVEEFHKSVVSKRGHPMVGSASLTVTRCNGGIADNVIPDYCDLMLDRRMVPGETEDQVVTEIEQLVAAAKRNFGISAECIRFQATTGGASETPVDAPIVAASLAASQRHGAIPTAPSGFSGGCDLVHFRSIGAQGVVVGPGSLGVAHKPDEFVPVDEFVASSQIYRDIALAMMHA
jgi:acetylornithine deacetylase/succinyl-diaminopimelate desuccinylase family protein